MRTYQLFLFQLFTVTQGYFRIIQGLLQRAKGKDLEIAMTHVKYCLAITPEDKTFKKQLLDVETKMLESAKNSNNLKNHEPVVPKSTNTVKTNSNVTTTVKNSSKEDGNKTNETGNNSNTQNDEIETETEKIRGYKLTTDGRKTTFFNNEMDEQTKALIGDIAPQKILHVEEKNVPVVPGGGSAWNAAGTFESVDHCKYFHLSCTVYSYMSIFFLYVLFFYLLIFAVLFI